MAMPACTPADHRHGASLRLTRLRAACIHLPGPAPTDVPVWGCLPGLSEFTAERLACSLDGYWGSAPIVADLSRCGGSLFASTCAQPLVGVGWRVRRGGCARRDLANDVDHRAVPILHDGDDPAVPSREILNRPAGAALGLLLQLVDRGDG